MVSNIVENLEQWSYDNKVVLCVHMHQGTTNISCIYNGLLLLWRGYATGTGSHDHFMFGESK